MVKKTASSRSLEQQYPCSMCGKLFGSRRNLGCHFRQRCGTRAPRVQAECGKWLVNKWKAKQHDKKCKAFGIECHICGECCIKKEGIEKHISMEHKNQVALSSEDEKFRPSLYQMMITVCKFCETMFTNYNEGIQHVKDHHKDEAIAKANSNPSANANTRRN